jgi:hypothetical protein
LLEGLSPSLPPSLPSRLPFHELARCHEDHDRPLSLSLSLSLSLARSLSLRALSFSLSLSLSLPSPPLSRFLSPFKNAKLSPPHTHSHPSLSRRSDNHKLFADVPEGRACGLSTPCVCVCVCVCVFACYAMSISSVFLTMITNFSPSSSEIPLSMSRSTGVPSAFTRMMYTHLSLPASLN